ncbi:hypothetical protein DFJ43DRAFT_1081273 [Lentinula guzmanii]|uniref:Secreted protein n=1 Tax=Lentinula guzmanii TaxID=2804957 RepID=A0AA38N020_9AGAR|nr:hypothetical protein DFJ43DRAFT_1081273 [Lentinula guzmanii]
MISVPSSNCIFFSLSLLQLFLLLERIGNIVSAWRVNSIPSKTGRCMRTPQDSSFTTPSGFSFSRAPVIVFERSVRG